MVTIRLPRRCSSLSFFHPSTNRRMYVFASIGQNRTGLELPSCSHYR
jgi:hypothetical protein